MIIDRFPFHVCIRLLPSQDDHVQLLQRKVLNKKAICLIRGSGSFYYSHVTSPAHIAISFVNLHKHYPNNPLFKSHESKFYTSLKKTRINETKGYLHLIMNPLHIFNMSFGWRTHVEKEKHFFSHKLLLCKVVTAEIF